MLVSFKKGVKANLPTRNIVPGSYYQCTDTGELYFGASTTQMVLVGPGPSNVTPKVDSGNGSIGSSTLFARADHVHPSDTSKVANTITVTGTDGLTGGGALSANVQIKHGAKPTSGEDAGGSGNYVTSVVIDSRGHVVSTSKGTLPTIPSASNTTPKMSSGTGNAGADTSWSRADHVHPSDSSKLDNSKFTDHTGATNPHNVNASQVGLGNVTNTKQVPFSYLYDQNASKVATLDSSNKIPSALLPAYVDDVLEYSSLSNFPSTGESGIIYVAKDTNLTYRWSGSSFVEISKSLALGETSSTAYPGNKGKTAYDHSQVVSGNPHRVTKSDVGLGNVDNTADADKEVRYADEAGKATNDGSGNTISSTYAKLSGATFTGPIIVPQASESSDERIKTVIANVSDSGSVLDNLAMFRKVVYILNNDKSQTPQIGVVAQEVETVYPELVAVDADGVKSVNYSRIGVLALAAIDELYDRVAVLEKKLK